MSARGLIAARLRHAWPWLLLALLWFLPLNTPPLFNPDEGRYAEIPREMVASGDWVTPRLDGLLYFEKPPLQYWATAAAYRMAGAHAWTVRWWPALCGYLGLLLTFLMGRRFYGRRAATFAVLIQASALLYVAMARVATLDMSLSFTLQLTLCALALLLERSRVAVEPATRAAAEPTANPRTAAVLLGLGMALAMLSKGLIGILIPVAVAGCYLLIYRDWRRLLTARPSWSVVTLVLLAAPWFVLVSLRHPSFPRFFFLYEHFQRYLSRAGFDRYQPPWFFVPVLLAGLLPWTSLLPAALLEGLRIARREPVTGLLLIWSTFILLFFSFSQSKLVPYILPMMPAIALLMGRTVADLPARRLARHLYALAIGAAAVAVGLIVVWQLPQASRLVARASTASILASLTAFGMLAAGACVGGALCGRGRTLGGVVATAAGALLMAQALLIAAGSLPRMRAETQLAQQLQPWVANYRNLYCVGDYVQAVPFYWRRTCTLVGYRGELDFGLTQDPARGIDRLEDFERRWGQEHSALAILRPPLYERLQALGMPMHVIYTAPSFVVIVRQ